MIGDSEDATSRDLWKCVAGDGLYCCQVFCRVDGHTLGCGAKRAFVEDSDVVLGVAARLGDTEGSSLATSVSNGVTTN